MGRRAFGVALGALASSPGCDKHSPTPLSSANGPSDEGRLPDLGGAVAWLNSVPLSAESLRGKVALVSFWTYTCINSLRPLPYVKSWAAKYKDAGLVVIGVHTPEFSFESERANVETAVQRLNVTYPVAMDSDYKIWRAFDNEYWPAFYFIDGKGRIRSHHFGEGDYAEAEHILQGLLRENGVRAVDGSTASVSADGVEAAPDAENVQSPETYVGHARAERFASSERVLRDAPRIYEPPARFSLNQWALSGSWNVGAESAALQAAPGRPSGPGGTSTTSRRSAAAPGISRTGPRSRS